MTKTLLTRRDLARKALAGAAGTLVAALAFSVRSQAAQPTPQVVDPLPAVPPPLPRSLPDASSQSTPFMTTNLPSEGELLTQLVPVAAGYTLSETQAKEAAAQLKGYPGGFAKARAYALPDDVGPAFAADAPTRKERVR